MQKMMRAVLALMVAALAVPAQAGEAEVKALVAKKAAILTNLHQKAEKALVNSAQDKIFGEYFGPSGDKKALKRRIDQLSLNVQANFQVEEMCLINEKGEEISRIVGKEVAPDAELATDETNSSFFKAAFAKEVKQVFVGPIYLSADANKWVVAYSTPIRGADRKAAILHYEHGLGVYQQNLDKDTKGGDLFVLAVDRQGYVVSDSRKRPGVDKQGEKKELADYFAKLPAALAGAVKLGSEGTATLSLDGAPHIVAFKPVQDWTILVAEKQK